MPECSVCGVDVSDCTEVESDGKKAWRQPVKRGTKPDGATLVTGGLLHIEGGRRCLADVEARRR